MSSAASSAAERGVTREFPIGAILSVVTGVMVSENNIRGVYQILEWMTDTRLRFWQLALTADAVRPAILAAHPSLALAVSEAESITPKTAREWLALCRDRYGNSLAIPHP
jgi:hypothetical protein